MLSANPIFYNIPQFHEKVNFYLKIEGLNIAHSIKLKTAIYLLNDLEKNFGITPEKNTIIESSSGNLGVALSILCKERGYRFICVTDPNISSQNENLIRCYGATVLKVEEKDENGGYLKTRIRYIHHQLSLHKNMAWTNQYANENNILAHYETTAKEILDEIKNIDYLFVGAGTTGTLMGCLRYFKKHSPKTKVIAVDAEGSVTFGGAPKKRYIPGIGTSEKPEISQYETVENIMTIDEPATIRCAHHMLSTYGLLLGGSSCSVIEAVKRYPFTPYQQANVVAICPDLGEKYLNTIYNPSWVSKHFNLALEN
jgi:cysteine synthase A